MNVSLPLSATFRARAFGIAETGTTPQRVLRTRRVPTAGVPCDRTATAKNDLFAITVNADAIGGIVRVDLERGASAAEKAGPNSLNTSEKYHGR